ncbi:MAG TPA: LPXTG cell wall anchor domain-containing protein [Actinomycetes bacterium]|nr:LPXTG cell wall anchor domain-containing protein [Actinomycetes bacterium]
MPDSHRLRTLSGVIAVATALTLAIPFAGSASAATTAPTGPATTDAADAAAGWLARQLVDGDHLTTAAGGATYPNAGLTADTVLALAAAGVGQDAAAKATAWLATPANLSGWIGDGTAESYAGSTAKAALVALTQGQSPTSFGGVDLLTRLRGLEQTSGAETGRFSDTSAYGDYSNTFGQSFAVIALERADAAGASIAAVDYLAAQQCTDGGFRLDLAAGAGACASDPDATALAVQALLLAGRDDAASKGLDFLEGRQQADGGVGGVGPTAGENANTTGLVAQALAAGERTDASAKAAAYLRGLQQGCAATAGARGAIAYDASGFVAGTAVAATTQAVLGLTGVGMATLNASGASAEAPVLDCPGPATPAASPTASVPAPAGATLPDTGSTSGPLALLGVGLVLAGAALRWATRHRGTHA